MNRAFDKHRPAVLS